MPTLNRRCQGTFRDWHRCATLHLPLRTLVALMHFDVLGQSLELLDGIRLFSLTFGDKAALSFRTPRESPLPLFSRETSLPTSPFVTGQTFRVARPGHHVKIANGALQHVYISQLWTVANCQHFSILNCLVTSSRTLSPVN